MIRRILYDDLTQHPVKVHRAFSLMELLVAISVIALLASVLLPSLTKARKHARRVVCLSNQRQIALAMHAYAMDNRDRFPVAQYIDPQQQAFVTWDTITYFDDPNTAKPGLIWQYASGSKVQQCPSYRGSSMTTGDPYTGYNYNTSYIGRGQGEGPFQGMTETPAMQSDIKRPGGTALIGDGGFASGANKFMRAPLDTGVSESVTHSGTQAFRHNDTTNVTFVDGHGQIITRRFRKPGAFAASEQLTDFPKNGFLSRDDSMYSGRLPSDYSGQ